MQLGEVISALEKYSPDRKVKNGFGNPHSFRGYYDQLAFEPVENTTVGEMLSAAKWANNRIMGGYKGGEYFMDKDTECWLSNYGTSIGAETISLEMIKYMVGDISEIIESISEN